MKTDETKRFCTAANMANGVSIVQLPVNAGF
jgi:hypothetical protein